ncbi:MAG: J domain-containing protein [Nitrospirae bacterium]|nr:J domain-containing protein [Nitrospirota bacterium]
MGKDYYKTLGVSHNASTDDLKKAYKRLAKKYHPDLNPGDRSAESKFKDISEAYAVLGNAEKRRQYDHVGPSGFHFDPREYRTTGGGVQFDLGGFDLGDLFDGIFGGRGGRGRGGSADPRDGSFRRPRSGAEWGGFGQQQMPHGGDLEYTLELEFDQAIEGYTAGINVNGEIIKVKIPAGVDNGSRVRVRQKGAVSPFGGPRGDLYIRVLVRPHPLFERKGKDLHVELPVTFPEAALGATVEVPSLHDRTKIKIPPGTSSGKVFRISGKGVRVTNGDGPGDLYVKVKIVVPKDLKGRAKDLVEQLGEELSENPRSSF